MHTGRQVYLNAYPTKNAHLLGNNPSQQWKVQTTLTTVEHPPQSLLALVMACYLSQDKLFIYPVPGQQNVEF